MNIVLNFMDKIYGDSSTLSTIYIVGAVLLFVFIILLIFSLRSPDKKKQKILEEPNIDKDINKQEESVEEKIKEENIIKEEIVEENNAEIEPIKVGENELSSILDKVDVKSPEQTKDEIKETKEIEIPNLSSEIPDVDEYVDNIVKKTYEKNEQFSSVYVNDNTNTVKLDKVLDNLNVDKDIKEEIVPIEEKTIEEEKSIEEDNLKLQDETKITKEKKENNLSNLDELKASLEKKKEEVNTKQDDLKSKLENLNNNKPSNETLKAEDLLNKLNSLNK